VVAGTLTVAISTTGSLGLPAAFVAVGAVLGLFSVGYVAMGRHLPHAGAMYAYAAHGLGRWVGVGVAWTALLAYNLIQVSLSGAIGAAASPLVKDTAGIELPWWVYALAMWALVAVLGIARVDLNGRVLATLLVAEVALIVVYDLVYVTHPAVPTAAGMAWSTWSPAELARPGVGAILAIAVLGFVGFESALVFSEFSGLPRSRWVRPSARAHRAALGCGRRFPFPLDSRYASRRWDSRQVCLRPRHRTHSGGGRTGSAIASETLNPAVHPEKPAPLRWPGRPGLRSTAGVDPVRKRRQISSRSPCSSTTFCPQAKAMPGSSRCW
jgi:hypothetical protein